jgi:hypothetical protein
MKSEIKNEKISGISTVFGQEKLRVTCVERKYRVSDSKICFIITARKELDENTTQELLYEDMELKTFLANYQITDIVSVSPCEECANVAEKKVPRKASISNIMTKRSGMSTISDDILIKNDNMSTKHDVIHEAMKRRELLESLDLPETFVIKDYKKALEKKGIIVTNTAMPYDDLDWLEKQGKVVRVGKGGRGAVSFRIKKS